ncbi:hypothetical protein [Shewanella algae]|uniref:hypothetical protein n=1 Tax=Shewanella algae TaxID=38313 RepID=UPI003006D2FA
MNEIKISLQESQSAGFKKCNEWSGTLEQLSKTVFANHIITEDKNTVPAFVPNTFIYDYPNQSIKREASSMDKQYCLHLDYDTGLTIEQWLEKYGHLEHLIWTSYSNDPVSGIQKFHVLVPLSEPVNGEQYNNARQWIQDYFDYSEKYRVDKTCLYRTHVSYFPSTSKDRAQYARVIYGAGKAFDIPEDKLISIDFKPVVDSKLNRCQSIIFSDEADEQQRRDNIVEQMIEKCSGIMHYDDLLKVASGLKNAEYDLVIISEVLSMLACKGSGVNIKQLLQSSRADSKTTFGTIVHYAKNGALCTCYTKTKSK